MHTHNVAGQNEKKPHHTIAETATAAPKNLSDFISIFLESHEHFVPLSHVILCVRVQARQEVIIQMNSAISTALLTK